MMRHFRAAGRLLALSVVTGLLYTGRQAAAAWLGLRGRPVAPLEARLMGAWARAACRIVNLRSEVSGTPPAPPFLLVSNHLGYADIVLLAAHAPAAFVSKAEVATWPVAGALCRAVGTIFIDRERSRDIPRATAGIEEALSAGRGVVVFPEGTSSDGSAVLPFRPPLLEVAARSRLPVSLAAIRYETMEGDPLASEAVCWWGTMTLGDHLWRFLGLRGAKARLRFGGEKIAGEDRKDLARRLHRAVADLLSEEETRGAAAAGTVME